MMLSQLIMMQLFKITNVNVNKIIMINKLMINFSNSQQEIKITKKDNVNNN